MGKDKREVGIKVFEAVVVPVRNGKAGAKSIRFPDFEAAMALARKSGARIVFDLPGEKEPLDVGLFVQADEGMPLEDVLKGGAWNTVEEKQREAKEEDEYVAPGIGDAGKVEEADGGPSIAE